MNQTKLPQRTAVAAYGAAVLFATHLVTYFIPSIRDVTTSSSMIALPLSCFHFGLRSLDVSSHKGMCFNRATFRYKLSKHLL